MKNLKLTLLSLALASSALSLSLAQNPAHPVQSCLGDYDGNGFISAFDLTCFLSTFGSECDTLEQDSCTAITPALDIIPLWNYYYNDAPNPNTSFTGLHQVGEDTISWIDIEDECLIEWYSGDSLQIESGTALLVAIGSDMTFGEAASHGLCSGTSPLWCVILHQPTGYIYRRQIISHLQITFTVEMCLAAGYESDYCTYLLAENQNSVENYDPLLTPTFFPACEFGYSVLDVPGFEVYDPQPPLHYCVNCQY